MSKIYEVTLHRVTEHETTYRVHAESEEDAEELVFCGDYDEITEDSELGEVEEPYTIDITRV